MNRHKQVTTHHHTILLAKIVLLRHVYYDYTHSFLEFKSYGGNAFF